MSQKSFLVTGGAGFIGSHLVRLLKKKGFQVVVLDALTYAGHLDTLADCLGSDQVRFVRGRVEDREQVRQLFQDFSFQGVFHLAAESHVDRSIEGPGAFVETNILGTATLLQVALDYYRKLPPPEASAFRYLQISTDEVFGSLGPTGFFNEKSPIQPNSPYSASKASADLLARAWIQTYGFPAIVTHCSNNYGSFQYPEKLIPLMIQQAVRGERLPVYGDGSHQRDWIPVQDHCQGLWLAYERGQVGASYCFGGRTEKTNLELVYLICDLLQQVRPRLPEQSSYRSQVSFVKDRLGHDHRYAIDDTLAVEALGFRHTYATQDFPVALKETLLWYLSHEAWCRAVLNEKEKK